jgi:ketopantoate hydroxymethyltransferase
VKLSEEIKEAFGRYIRDIKENKFPSKAESY